MEKNFNDFQKYKKRLKSTIGNRWGPPENLLDPVAFLLSASFYYMTGSDLYVDGEWICNGGL